jgi:predicted dehydrogenase
MKRELDALPEAVRQAHERICLAIREAAEKSGKVFAFGLVLRYSPHCQQVKELILSGILGRILSFEFNGASPGGWLNGTKTSLTVAIHRKRALYTGR